MEDKRMDDAISARPHSAPARWAHGPSLVLGLMAVAGLVALFYAEENVRHRRAWQKYKAQLEAKGLVLDWRAYRPTPVPDEQNFAKTPLIEREGYKGPTPTTFGQAVPGWSQALGDWTHGQSNNLKALEASLARPAPDRPPLTSAPPAVLAWSAFQVVEPAFNELREASRRPDARFDASGDDPWDLRTPSFVFVRNVCQMLTVHASACLAEGRTKEALADMRVIQRFGEALRTHQTLVAAMIRVAVLGGPGIQNFWEGWRTGQWSGDELAELQGWFSSTDLLSAYQASLNGGERAGVTWLVEHYSRRKMVEIFSGAGRAGGGSGGWFATAWQQAVAGLENAPLWLMPNGWLYRSLLNYDRLMEPAVAACDPQAKRYYPAQAQAAADAAQTHLATCGASDLLLRAAMPNVVKAGSRAAFYQTLVDEASVVCALERYKLKQGRYPEGLHELVPQYLTRLPHDIITGQPLHYRRDGNNRFLLYAVGLDGKDDGGVAGTDTGSGDWAWPR